MDVCFEMGSTAAIVTGASGFLGWNILRDFVLRGYSTTGTYSRTNPDTDVAAQWRRLSLTDMQDIAALRELGPQYIVHCAALSRRDLCERDPDAAERINVHATREVAEIAREWDMPMVYISTDLVFDGSDAPYDEHDPVTPASVYGRSKVRGEDVVRETCTRHYIVRTALMYGELQGAPGSFLGWTAEGLRSGAGLDLYVNQYRSVLFAPDVAVLLHGLLEHNAPYGTYHAGGPERLSRYDIGCRLADTMGISRTLLRRATLDVQNPHGTDDTTLRCTKAETAAAMRFTSLNDGLMQLRHILKEEEKPQRHKDTE
jgi:dTDP-4-dehydrorhamnose reductase